MFSRLKGVSKGMGPNTKSTIHKRKRQIRGGKKKKHPVRTTRGTRNEGRGGGGVSYVEEREGYNDRKRGIDEDTEAAWDFAASSSSSPYSSPIRNGGFVRKTDNTFAPSPVRLDADSLVKDSSDVRREVEKKVEEIERRYDTKFRTIRDELRKVREEEARAAIVLKQTCDEKVATLEEKVRHLEGQKVEFEHVKTRLSEQAKQGFIDLYQDLTKKSKDVAEALRVEKEKTSVALANANEKIDELAYALKAQKELHQRVLLEHKQATQNLESLLADARSEAERSRAELATQRKSMTEMQESRLERANREAKEILDLSRQETAEYKKDLARERRKVAVLEEEMLAKFKTFCTNLESEMRTRSLEIIETKLRSGCTSASSMFPKNVTERDVDVMSEPMSESTFSLVAAKSDKISESTTEATSTSSAPAVTSAKVSSVVDAEAAIAKLKKFIEKQRNSHQKMP